MVNHTIDNAKRVALYVRVSTDGQTTVNQQRELEAAAERHGWLVVDLFKDHAISGKNGREKRPAFDRMLQGVARKDFDLIAAWSVDRLGRSLQHLLAFLSELKAKGVDLYLHQQAVDTSTPAGRALFQMLGVFAEFERAMIVERVKAGLRRATVQGRSSAVRVSRRRWRRQFYANSRRATESTPWRAPLGRGPGLFSAL